MRCGTKHAISVTRHRGISTEDKSKLLGLVESGNFASAQSDDIGLITGTLSAVTAPSDAAGDLTGLSGASDLAGTTGPAVPGIGGMGGGCCH